MNGLFLGREPGLVLGFLGAVISLVVGFGVDFTPEQIGLLMAVVTTGIALIVRPQTTPLIDPKASDGTPLVKITEK